MCSTHYVPIGNRLSAEITNQINKYDKDDDIAKWALPLQDMKRNELADCPAMSEDIGVKKKKVDKGLRLQR